MNAVAERSVSMAKARTTSLLDAIKRATVSQNAEGEWLCNGEVVKCSLGGHEGMARSRALCLDVAALFDCATPKERERMSSIARAGFNCIEDLLR